MPHSKADARVLILAPLGRDAAAIQALLEAHGIASLCCGDSSECAQRILEGAGALLLAEEAMEGPGVARLFDALKAQPAWSELPIVILTGGGESRAGKVLSLMASTAGSATFLERPMRTLTLVRSVEVALRSRRRQYQTRDLLAEQERNQGALEEQARQQRILFRLTHFLTLAASLREVYDRALDSMLEAFACQRAALFLIDEEETSRCRASRGFSAACHEALEGHSRRQANDAESEASLVEDLAGADLDPGLRAALLTEGVAAFAVFPLVLGKFFGRLAVYFDEPRKLSPEEAQLAQSIANQLAFALERKRSEEKLRESEEMFRTMADNIAQFAWIANARGWIFWYNKRWYDYTGTTLDEMRGWGWTRVHHPDHIDRVVKRVQRAWDTGEPWEDLFPLRGKNGEYRWFLSRALPIRDADGAIVRWFGTNTDVTEQRAAEQAVRESEERFRVMADTSPVIIWMTDQVHSCVYLNPRWSEITGQSDEAGMGLGWLNVVHPDERAALRETFLTAAKDHKPFRLEYRLRRAEGGYRWALDAAAPRLSPAGDFLGYVGSVVDIDDQKRAAEKLERTVAERTTELRETNEQLEAFVYSIAHDLRAPLRSMTGYSQILADDHADELNEGARPLLRRIQASAAFMDKLLLDLLAFGRTARAEISFDPVSVQAAWDSAVSQCAERIHERGARIEIATPLPVVRAHEATLSQCLANLLSNALKFVEPEVTPIIRLTAEIRGLRVRLWLEDNGIGIPEDQRERVFRVFERMHGSRFPGTGIGLSIVRKGVERMGGQIGLESAAGGGSRFWIELDRVSAS